MRTLHHITEKLNINSWFASDMSFRTQVRRMVIIIVALMSLAVPSVASASGYFISQRVAEANTPSIVEAMYAGKGISATDAMCRPQGAATWANTPYRYHRWTCYWTGSDHAGHDVHGFVRITGHNGGYLGYLSVYGGVHWD